MRKSLLWVGALLLAMVGYNLDAITGQWKFNKMCRDEGGPRFYGPVEKDVGWEVEGHDKYDFGWPFYFENIAFVRYQDNHGNRFDVRTDGWLGANERKYIFVAANETLPIRYHYRYLDAQLPDDSRFSKTQHLVVEAASGQLVASFTEFGYSWTSPERVILAAPTGQSCWALQSDINKFYQNIYKFGSNK